MAKENLIDEGTNFLLMSEEELRYFLKTFSTYAQTRRRIKSRKAAEKRRLRNARRSKKNTEKNF